MQRYLNLLNSGTSPLLSISTIDGLGLYTPVLGIPPALQGKTSGTLEAQSTAVDAASLLCDLLSPTPTLIPAVHQLLLDPAREDLDVRKRLIFGAALTPWKHMTYQEKKKTISAIEGIIKDGLKVSQPPNVQFVSYTVCQIGGQSHFATSIPSLFAAHEKISNPLLEQFEGPEERALIGMYACPLCFCMTQTPIP